MKTTLDIADPVLTQAKRLAARRGTSVKALVELGLRRVIAEAAQDSQFRLRKASFKGKGLAIEGATWADLREWAYEGRGG